MASLQARLRSRGVMVLIAAIGLGIIGAKLFWPEPPRLKMAAAAPAAKPNKTTATTRSSSPTAPAKPKAAASANPSPLTASRKPAPKTKPADEPPATIAESAAAQPAPNPSPAPATAPPPAPSPAPAAPVAAPAPLAKSPAAGEAPVSRPRPVASAPARPADALGPPFIDEINGYSIRFPAGWTIRTFGGEPWVVDCGDGRIGLISIGFSPFPTGFTTESIPPEWIARRIQRRADTTLHAQGYATIAGKRALWSKSTGPLPMSHASPRMTRVNYILPTGDGRVLELRVAAAPEQFDRLVPVMRKAVETFKLLPAAGQETVAVSR